MPAWIRILSIWTVGLFALGCGASADMAEAGSANYAPGAPGPTAVSREESGGEMAPMEPTSDLQGLLDDDSESRDYLAQAAAPPPPAPPPPPSTKPEPESKPDAGGGEVVQVTGPLLIFTADFVMAVFEVQKSLDAMEAAGRDLGGFLARRDDHSITIRVPAARFDEAVARVEKLGDVVSRNVSSEDVTDQFRDLTIRLQNATAMRDRLEKLLAKADKVEDALNVERELGRVTEEIELIKGRLKFLKDRVSFSTLTVQFRPRGSEHLGSRPVQLPLPWLNDLGLNRLMNL